MTTVPVRRRLRKWMDEEASRMLYTNVAPDPPGPSQLQLPHEVQPAKVTFLPKGFVMAMLLFCAAACGETSPPPTSTPAPEQAVVVKKEAVPPAVQSTPERVPGQTVPEQPYWPHVEPLEEHEPYNSVPATSGRHYGLVAKWGIYTDFIPDKVMVHNLEHGGVAIRYDCPAGCDELVRELAALVAAAADEGKKVIMSPYPQMDTRIALAAWTFIDKFDDFDSDRINNFIEAHESSPNAPEPLVR